MTETTRRSDSSPVLDIFPVEEEIWEPRQRASEEELIEHSADRPRQVHCEHARRELYRSHFPLPR